MITLWKFVQQSWHFPTLRWCTHWSCLETKQAVAKHTHVKDVNDALGEILRKMVVVVIIGDGFEDVAPLFSSWMDWWEVLYRMHPSAIPPLVHSVSSRELPCRHWGYWRPKGKHFTTHPLCISTFLNVQVARTITSVFLRNVCWLYGCSWGETKYS